ncbi:RluA family pseudouridine synthase [Helicobacter colisuis]|uniref:RluA family pseudouridine synthase n=1 Tax=Helicobacter colisuis TaxID=2949739 RepID=UPI002029BD20|nr:RluA family pseudouridine synthase [Helicobacter colisuis]MCL9821969.1 RluA family pseudouridine synthase [Helicobacter colisuis]
MPFIKQKFYFQTPIKAYLFLIRQFNLNMAQAQSYINKGRVVYEGKILGNNEKNKILEREVEVWIFKPNSIGLKPIYENEDFALFSKPAQMLIHPKGRFFHHSLIDEVREYFGVEASLIHRIDKETSGLVLVGKHKKSIVELGELFANNRIKKKYLALIKGKMRKTSKIFGDFCLLMPLSLQEKGGDLSVRSVFLGQNLRKDSRLLGFRDAKSEFEILGEFGENTLLKVYPITGRTHQIRVHLFSIGFPILGDPLYGCEDWQSREYLDSEFIEENRDFGLCAQKRKEYFGAERLMLHAYSLEFSYKGREYYFRSCERFYL